MAQRLCKRISAYNRCLGFYLDVQQTEERMSCSSLSVFHLINLGGGLSTVDEKKRRKFDIDLPMVYGYFHAFFVPG
jgi:hypothetical protein